MSTSRARLILLIPPAIIETLIMITFRMALHRPAIIFFYALSVNFILLGIWTVFLWPFAFNPLRRLPTIHGPFLGARMFMARPRGKIVVDWLRTIPNEDLIHFREGWNFSVVIPTSPRALTDIFCTNCYDFVKPSSLRHLIGHILGQGLFTSEGGAHRANRKALTPAFTIKNIRSLYPLMWTKTLRFLSQLENEIKDCPAPDTEPGQLAGFVEIGKWVDRLALDIIGLTATSRDFQSLDNDNDPVPKYCTAIMKPSAEKLALLGASGRLPPSVLKILPFNSSTVVLRAVSCLRRVFQNIIHEKRQQPVPRKFQHGHVESDILSIMMRGGEFSDSLLVDQMMTFILSGYETIASAILSCCFHLSMEPHIQDELRKEIREKVTFPTASISWEVLEGMPYLNGVCQETLRLYPPAPFAVREAIRETIVAGKIIPKGTDVLLCPELINRSFEIWGKTADKFLPERWIDTDPDIGKRSRNKHGGASRNFAQATFLYGPRACIGKDFAKAEFRCLVAGLFGRFQLELGEPSGKISFGGLVTNRPLRMLLKLTKLEV